MRPFVTFIFLYACESWTLTAELQRRIQAMEMRCYRKMLRIFYKDHVTNEEVRAKIQKTIGPHECTLTIVKRCNCSGMDMSPIYQGCPKPSCKTQWKGGKDKADRKRSWKTTSGNGQAQVCQVPEGSGEPKKIEETGCEVICGAPTTLAVKGQVTVKVSMKEVRESWTEIMGRVIQLI